MKDFTDIQTLNWLPHQLQPYAKLMRLDRPIGAWLLLLPGWWALALNQGSLWQFTLFGVGAILLRGAGCIINDLWDRKIDQKVERTRLRPLASGAISVPQALVILASLLVLGLLTLLQFNYFAFLIGASSLILVISYPLMKRIIWWPQAVLGLTFNWGVLLATAAVLGHLTPSTMVLYAAGVCWTLAYDTLYAHQDKADDVLVGVKSLALRLGSQSRAYIGGFFILALWLLIITGLMNSLNWPFYTILLAAGAHAYWQVYFWRPENPADCLKRFKSNRDFGLIVLAAFLATRI
jgi:4-hydroxybenzoate polyprenyltransferase